MERTKAALVLNAPELDASIIAEDFIVAADAGFRHLSGRNVAALVGDLDTLGSAPEGVMLIRYPIEKNATDGELAIDYLNSLNFKEITIYGAFGGKIEHVLGNLNLLAYADSLGISAKIDDGKEKAWFSKSRLEIDSLPGDEVSIFPFGGCASVSHSEGLYYPLENLLLKPEKSRGISNRATDEKIVLEIASGAVIVILRRKG